MHDYIFFYELYFHANFSKLLLCDIKKKNDRFFILILRTEFFVLDRAVPP